LLPVFAGALLLSCELVTQPELDEDFRLAPGQTAVIAGTELSVSFRQVVADSRCPSNVVCVWTGNGEVELAVRTASGTAIPHVLGTPAGPLEVVVSPYRIRILGLDPYPGVSPIPPNEYRLRLRVEAE
jgi:hypothetical protein